MKRVWKVLLCVAIISSMLLTSVFAASYPDPDTEPFPEKEHNANLTGVENARDLGGYETEDGYFIKEDVLFRSGNLHEADPAQIKDKGITKIIDLRTKLEALRKPDVDVEGAELVPISMLTIPNPFVLEGDDWKTLLKAITTGIMETWDANLYRQYIQDPNAIKATKQFFAEVLDNKGAPLLWHCTAGKDRTGVEAMLLMAALGCDYDTIRQDFMLTNAYYQQKARDSYDKAYKLTHIKAIATEFYKYEIVKEEWLNISMDVMRRMTGESNNDAALQKYLRDEIDLTDEDIATLKGYYLVPAENTAGTKGANTDSITTMSVAPAA